MVNKINFHIDALKRVFSDYQLFLNESLNRIPNKAELLDYIKYVNESQSHFEKYIHNLNKENSIFLYTLIGGICRYFSEFAWPDIGDFHIKAEDFKNRLTEESNIIYSHFLESGT